MGRALRHREQLDMMGAVAPGALWFWWGVGLWGSPGHGGESKVQWAAEYSGALGHGVGGMGTLGLVGSLGHRKGT